MLYRRPASEIFVTIPPCLWDWLGDKGLLAPGLVMHTMEAPGRIPAQLSGCYSMACPINQTLPKCMSLSQVICEAWM